MSSRAVRKALKQRELEGAQAKLASLGIGAAQPKAEGVAQDGDGEEGREEDDDDEEEEEEEEEQSISLPRVKPNLFAMLGGDDDEEEKDEDEDEDEEEETAPSKSTSTTTSKSKKKKNKKKKKKKTPQNPTPLQPPQAKEDELDHALRLLNLKPSSSIPKPGTSQPTTIDTDLLTLLKIDPKNLDASQEMRRLFGRAAMDTSDEGGGRGRGAGTPRGARRGAQRSGVVPSAQGGRGIMMKKTLFAQPKATWPNAGSGGLGMALVEHGHDAGVGEKGVEGCEFKFVHGTGYQDVQRQFMMCVMSMGLFPPPHSCFK